MRKVVEYSNLQERQNIIAENSHLILIEEQNITEGNFLIFSDKPIPKRIIYTQIPAEEIEAIKQSIAELTIIIGGGV